MILFLGGGMIAREIEGRTIFLMLSKPIARSSIFLGKFLGFALVVLLMLGFQTGVLLAIFFFRDIPLDYLFVPAVAGILLKLFSLLAVILFFSSFTSPLVAMFLTISSYMIGHSGYMMLEYAGWNHNPTLALLGRAILSLFPNLESLNLKNYVATDAPIDLVNYWTTYGVDIGYVVVLLFLGALIFSKKSFDNA